MKKSGKFAAVLMALLAASAFADGRSAETLFLSHVHRGGGARERPDNTLETFRWAWENGAGVECDCRLAGDGTPILLHDGNLLRTGRAKDRALLTNKVSNLSYAQITNADVGLYLGPRFRGQRVPRLEDVFAELKGHPRRLAFVDEKGIGPERLSAMAKSAGVFDQVWYTAGSYKQIRKWWDVSGGKSRFWINARRTCIDGGWRVDRSAEALAAAGRSVDKVLAPARAEGFKGVTLVNVAIAWDPDEEEPFLPSTAYLKALIAELHAKGVYFSAQMDFGGMTPDGYRAAWELGADCFCTDYPSAMFAAMAEIREGRPAVKRTASFRPVRTEPVPRDGIHLQGFDCDESGIYWGFGREVLKTDWSGRILAEGISRFEPDQGFGQKVRGHIGDVCVASGRVWATSWYMPPGKSGYANAVAEIQVFDARTMKRLDSRPMPCGVDGVTCLDGVFYSRHNWERASKGFFPDADPARAAVVIRWKDDFRTEDRRILFRTDGSPIDGGFQTMTAWNGLIWGCSYAGYDPSGENYPRHNRTFLCLPDGTPLAGCDLDGACGLAVVPRTIAGDRKLFIVGSNRAVKGADGTRRTVGLARYVEWRDGEFVPLR